MRDGALYLIRGLPGSGKSSLARHLKDMFGHAHYEADMFFIDKMTGAWNYDPSKVKEAHEWCQSAAFTAAIQGKTVVVTNTFTRLWEMDPYLEFAMRHRMEFQVTVMTTHYTNRHGVPEEKIKEMAARWERCHGESVVQDPNAPGPLSDLYRAKDA